MQYFQGTSTPNRNHISSEDHPLMDSPQPTTVFIELTSFTIIVRYQERWKTAFPCITASASHHCSHILTLEGGYEWPERQTQQMAYPEREYGANPLIRLLNWDTWTSPNTCSWNEATSVITNNFCARRIFKRPEMEATNLLHGIHVWRQTNHNSSEGEREEGEKVNRRVLYVKT